MCAGTLREAYSVSMLDLSSVLRSMVSCLIVPWPRPGLGVKKLVSAPCFEEFKIVAYPE